MLAIPIRDDTPIRRPPVVTWALIVACASVFLWQASLPSRVADRISLEFGMIPAVLFGETQLPVRLRVVPAWLTPVTSMFLHGGWLHVLGNMWFLWIFGDNIEDILGHEKYLIFYLLCGVAAALSQVMLNVDSRVPMVGASGAIAGVMGANLVNFPQSRIVTLSFFIFIAFIDVPAWAMLIYWFAIQFFSGIGSIGHTTASDGGTAFFAHVGGFITGIVLIKVMGTRERYSQRRDLYW